MCIFLNENVCIAIKLRCVYNGRRCPGDKPFSGTMMVSLLTYMFITKLTLISVCISNHMCNIVWYEITWLISTLCNVCNYLPMLGQKLINATKKGADGQASSGNVSLSGAVITRFGFRIYYKHNTQICTKSQWTSVSISGMRVSFDVFDIF